MCTIGQKVDDVIARMDRVERIVGTLVDKRCGVKLEQLQSEKQYEAFIASVRDNREEIVG